MSRLHAALQRLILVILIVGAACAAILAVVGVCMVVSTAAGTLSLPVVVAIGAAIGWLAYRLDNR